MLDTLVCACGSPIETPPRSLNRPGDGTCGERRLDRRARHTDTPSGPQSAQHAAVRPEYLYIEPHEECAHAAFRASAWSVGLAGGHGGGRICPREVSARRSASGGRCRSAMCQTRSAASAAGIPAAVTSNGAYRGAAQDRHRVGGRMKPGPGHAGHRYAEVGVLLGLLARALTGMSAIWPAVGGASAGAIAVACATGRFRRKREEQRGPEHRGQSSCSRRHANARLKKAG